MSFSSILPPGSGGGHDEFDIFSVTAADELGPIPAGRYAAIAARGGPKTAKTGTKGYEIEFRVTDGQFAGRRVWKFFAFTPKAAAISRRDLEKFGITTREQLDRDLPPERFVVEMFVALRTDGRTGTQANDVKSFKVVRVEDPKPDPFAPAAPTPPPKLQAGEGESALFSPDPGLGGLRQ